MFRGSASDCSTSSIGDWHSCRLRNGERGCEGVSGKENAMKRIILGLLFLVTSVSNLQAQSPFYKGKSIKLVVGSPAGSNYDQYGRLIAPYLSKHIAGNPEVVVQNIGGAGSVIAANQVYRVAAPDGLTLVSILPAIYLDQLVG